MAMRHYYIEDTSVDPQREDKIKPVPSIQFNEGWDDEDDIEKKEKTVIVTIEDAKGKNISVRVLVEEIKNAYEWIANKN